MLFVRRTIKQISKSNWNTAKFYKKQGLYIFGNDTILDAYDLMKKNDMSVVPVCCDFTKKMEYFITKDELKPQVKMEQWLLEQDKQVLDNMLRS